MNIQTLLGSIRKKHLTAARSKADARRKRSLKVETLEGRVVPATLPAPVIDQTSHRPIHNVDFSPTLVADPTNPFTIVQANQFYVNTNSNSPVTTAAKNDTIVEIMISRNAGESFQVLAVPSKGLDPKTNQLYTQVGTPSVAFDRFGNIFVAYTEHGEDFTSGRLILRKFSTADGSEIDLRPGATFPGVQPRILYSWVDSDQAHNPFVAVDTNLATFQDPEVANSSGLQTDPFAQSVAAIPGAANQVQVFVAWNTVTIAPTNPVNFNPNVIKTILSSDGGVSFAAPVIVNNDRHVNATDRYAQPKMVFTPGRSGYENLANLTDVNGTLYFTSSTFRSPSMQYLGTELWKTDGTAVGTVLVRDIRTGGASSVPTHLTNVNGTLFFTANDGVNGIELWKSNGTTAGTVLVSDIRVGPLNSAPRNLVNVNGTLYFTADDGVNGEELWKSDGTPAGTVRVRDIMPGELGSDLKSLTNVNGTLYFTANNGANGEELWKSDGTTAGTVLVSDIIAGSTSSAPTSLTAVGNTLYFTADGTAGRELWKSDGTGAGTVLVLDIVAGSDSSGPANLTASGTRLFFTANDGVNGNELWVSDGTGAGTIMVRDILAGFDGSTPAELTDVNGVLFFSANNGAVGTELWKSDGTNAGTVLVRDIYTGTTGTPAVPNSSTPLELTNVGGTLYFKATTAAAGEELWKSDGTNGGTVQVRDIRPLAAGSSIRSIVASGAAGNVAYFTATEGSELIAPSVTPVANGLELFRSTGTAAGTTSFTNPLTTAGPTRAVPPNPASPNGLGMGNADGIGGSLVTTYSDFGGGTSIRSDAHSFNALNVPNAIEVIAPNTVNGVFIQDALDTDNGNIPVATTINLNVPQALVGTLPGQLSRVDHINLTLSVDHDALDQVLIMLRSPDGKQKVLVRNRLAPSGTAYIPQQGIAGTAMGVVPPDQNPLGLSVGLSFQDNAARSITDPNLNATKTGYYRPEGLNFDQLGLGLFDTATPPGVPPTMINIFGTVPTAQIDGNWQLVIVDVVNSGNTNHPRVVRDVTLRLSQNFVDAQDADTSLGAAPAASSATGTNYPSKPVSNPNFGIGSGVSMAVDNTLGSYSPYQGRIYTAYTTGANVEVRYSDDNGRSWSGSTVVGPGFMPVIEVDDGTGTLMVAYYSTQGDASGARSAVMFTTAINQPLFGNQLGRIEFGTPQFINPSEQYFDQIRTKLMDFEPIRSNPSVEAMGRHAYGNNMGLVSNNGRVTLVYTGNMNTADLLNPNGSVASRAGTQTRTQKMRLTAGARAVGGDTGAILGDTAIPQTSGTLTTPPGDAQVTELLQGYDDISQVPVFVLGETRFFNNTFAADGLRRFDGFTVEFDRIVDPKTFNVNDIILKYHAPDANPALKGEDISGQLLRVERLDYYTDPVTGIDYGSKRYLIRLLPQSRVGSYSYSVGSNINDRVRELARDYVLGSPQSFNSQDTPVQIVDFIDPDIATPVASSIFVNGMPGVIGDVNVRVNIAHGDLANLTLALIPPVGPIIPLVAQNEAGPGGPGFTDTTFDDDAAQTLANDIPPYTSFASYKPSESLSQLFANQINGVWTLVVTDLAQGASGILNNWRIELTPATLQGPTLSIGNTRDQDGDAITNEPIEDTFAVPNPVNGVPFVLPYKSGSVPITITGPRLMETAVAGVPGSLDNVVVDKKVKTLDLRFDRTINASSFSAADVLRIIGPLGEIPILDNSVTPAKSLVTVTPITAFGGTALAANTNSKFFRIGFQEQDLAGNYRILLSSQIADTNGNLLDTDQDAGVAQMTGGDIGTPTVVRTYEKQFTTPTTIAANGVTNVPLTINDAYLIRQAITTLTVNHPNVRNLTFRLYGPTTPPGQGVLLMTNTPLSGSTANMLNTTFDDGAQFPIQTGSGPFPGSYNPIQPLAQLNNTSTQGTWRLEILNKGSATGTVSRFDLNLTGDVIGTGLGETNSDQASAGFRIHVSGGGTQVGKTNWSPIGPAGHWNDVNLNGVIDKGENNDTVGRVGAIAVDTVDPSGNTVYAAGASGGVWRTTNFLTRDAIGPTWVPLTDFGPTNAINIGSIVLYPSPDKDPSKTTILVGTGSDPLNQLEDDEMRGDPKYRFDGVGFLISTDAGRNWQVLDSTDNYNKTLNKPRPVVDAGSIAITSAQQVGTTVTITTSAAHAIPSGATVTISGVGVGGYNGTFVVTGVPASNKFTYTTTAGLGAGSGGLATTPDRRDHLFVGAVVNKLVVEDLVDPVSGLPIYWAAVGQGTAPAGAAGLWRSQDGGRSWTRIRAGEAIDFEFAEGSVRLNSLGRPTLGFLSIKGEGMFRSVQLNSAAPTFTLLVGGVGRPQLVGDLQNNTVVSVDAPPETPNGNKSRIALAVPSFVTGDPLANSYYQRWVYALVSEADGQFDGLYVSKDAGDNWTRLLTRPQIPEPNRFFTDFGGNHSVSLVVDPTDPNIVYIGSETVIRVDATFSNDPYNLSMYQHSNADGGVTRNFTRGGVDTTFDDVPFGNWGGGLDAESPPPIPLINTLTPTELNGPVRRDPRHRWNQLNSLRDPFQPFLTDTSLQTINVSKFFNDGADTVFQTPSVGREDNSPVELAKNSPFNWTSVLIPTIDPLTGKARILIGTDEGIGSFVNDSNGRLNEVVGFDQRGVNLTRPTPNPTVDTLIYKYTPQDESLEQRNLQIDGTRNGNLQVARLFSGDAQPSLLAASIAHSFSVAAGRRQGDVPVSDEDMLSTGQITWGDVGRIGRANYVTTDQTGTGTVYILRRINDMKPDALQEFQDFFQIQELGGTPISRTNGLFRNNPADQLGQGQWDNTVRNFSVNTVDPNGIIMGSNEGRLFRTLDKGLFWDVIAEPTDLDGSYTSALAFGSPLTDEIAEIDRTNLNDHIYAGTEDGGVFVTKIGGGSLANSWTDISNGLTGSGAILKIIPNPRRGTSGNPYPNRFELYLVSENGVYYMDDWTKPGAAWVNVTNNIPAISHQGFNRSDWELPVIQAQQDTPELLTIAVDWRPTQTSTPTRPILYAGGDGGVFRGQWTTLADGTQNVNWIRYTNPAMGAESQSGGLPLVKVTDLDLALGNIDPNTGKPTAVGSVDMLVATTLGRGQWAIAVGKPTGISGPKIVSATPTDPQFVSPTFIDVEFDTFMSVPSFDVNDVVIKGPNGEIIAATLVEDVTDQFIVPGELNLHNRFRIHFPLLTADGGYTFTIGSAITDGGGTPMNQDGDGVNGEPVEDQFRYELIVGTSDMADFIKDTYDAFLGRVPTNAEYKAKQIKAMETARLKGLTTVIKELLIDHNGNEARTVLVQRLFDNGGATGEIGGLLPAPYNATADIANFVLALENGSKTPESLIVDIMSKPEYFTLAGGTAAGFLNRIYADLFEGLGITPAMLPSSTQAKQLSQAGTPTGRAALVKSLVNGATVKYDPTPTPAPASPYLTTSFRTHFVKLTYAKYLPGYTPTTADINSGKSLMAKGPGINKLVGSENLIAKVLSTKLYFESKTQVGGQDDGLHTNRSWVAGVVFDRMNGRVATAAEQSTFSQKVLDTFAKQRQQFVQSVVYGTPYRTKVVNDYYQQIHLRVPTSTELTSALNSFKAGTQIPSLLAARFASTEFVNTNANNVPGANNGGAPANTWARAVYITLFGSPPLANEEAQLASQYGTAAKRKAAVLAILKGTNYRTKFINDTFELLLGRPANTAVGDNEVGAYLSFLNTKRWELMYADILSYGAAGFKPANPATTDLPREFWEIAN